MNRYKVGDIVEGIVTGIQNYGAFVMLEDDIVGLIHISEVSSKFVRSIDDFVKVDDKIMVKILEIDEVEKKAKLSIKSIREVEVKPSRYRNKPSVTQKGKKNTTYITYSFNGLASRLEQFTNEEWESLGGLSMLRLDLSHSGLESKIASYQEKVNECHEMLHKGTGEGNDFLGWLTWPKDYDYAELQRIIAAAQKINDKYDTLVVCGIGGSYLGAAAAIDALNGFYNNKKVEIIFFGNTFSPTYTHNVLNYLKGKNFAVNVISKSGTTTETSIAFRLCKNLLIEKYGKESLSERIFATTDKARGALKTEANAEGYETFVIPDNIGGRFSVLTAVGLLPIAVAGFDVREMMAGALKASVDFANPNLVTNISYQYAVARNILLEEGYKVEMFVTYEPHFTKVAEWWKQLFGESEGKDGKGLLPGSVNYSTDLHSLGQFVQDGSKVLFETILNLENAQADTVIPGDKENLDGLNYLEGKTLSFVNNKAMLGTLAAHEIDGKVPNLLINLKEMNAFNFGYLVYFFELACGMSAYILGVNPFNQPGVEIYKKNMFKLLGKF